MGRHYRSNTEGGPTGFLKALWNSARWCQWVEPNEGAKGENASVLFYRNRNGLGLAPAKISVPGEEKAAPRGMMLEPADDSE